MRRQTSLALYLTSSTELSDLRRGDPGLGEAAESEQIGEVLGVPGVVLHTAVAPAVAERVGEVDLAAQLLEQVGRPVPAVARLKDDLGVLAGGHDCLFERQKVVVVDLGHLEGLALGAAPDDDAPAPVQVDTDILSLLFHWGLPPS